MEFIHMSKDLYQISHIEEEHALISYADNLKTENKLIKDILYVENNDVDLIGRHQDYGNAEILEIGKDIFNFTESLKDKYEKTYIVCDAGLSRSVGTQKALNYIYNGIEEKTRLMNRQIYYSILDAVGHEINIEKEKENYRKEYPDYNVRREDLKGVNILDTIKFEM